MLGDLQRLNWMVDECGARVGIAISYGDYSKTIALKLRKALIFFFFLNSYW